MIYFQNHDKQVWKISDVKSEKEGDEGKLMEMMEKERYIVEKRQWWEQNNKQEHRQVSMI